MVIEAAGVVLHDDAGRVLIVHRPHRNDWSLPKGKLDRGEPAQAGAVRECHEETGVRAVLGAPLGELRYEVAGTPKRVRYWRARIHADDGFRPTDEVDEIRWCDPDSIGRLLSYPDDERLVRRSVQVGDTTPLGVLRHAQAVKRETWRRSGGRAAGSDSLRPLTFDGLGEAERLVPVLAAYDFGRVVSSPSRRCRQTVMPYAAALGLSVVEDDRFSEEGHRQDRSGTTEALTDLARDPRSVLLCTHRPVLGAVFDTLASILGDVDDLPAGALDHHLQPAEIVVLHRGPDGRILAAERITS